MSILQNINFKFIKDIKLLHLLFKFNDTLIFNVMALQFFKINFVAIALNLNTRKFCLHASLQAYEV